MRPPRFIPAALAWVAATVAFGHPGLHHDIAKATAAIALEPARSDLYVERAFLFRLDEEYQAALGDLDEARRLDPANLRVAAERGMTLSALGRDAEAYVELTRFVRHGGTAATFTERAEIQVRLGRRREAIADYSAAIALDPNVESYVDRGALQESLGEWAAAAAGYRDALARLGDAVTIDLALIRAETARGRYDAALEVVDFELAGAAVKADWYLKRAEVLSAAGRAAEAVGAREKALRAADDAVEQNGNGMHLLSRAKVRMALGQLEGAKQDLELVLMKSPRFAEAREMLAAMGPARNDEGMKP